MTKIIVAKYKFNIWKIKFNNILQILGKKIIYYDY